MTAMKELVFLAFLSSYFMSIVPDSKPEFRLPGTSKVVDNFFVDQREVCNIDWREYLNWIKENEGDNSKRYLNALPNNCLLYTSPSPRDRG